MAERMVDRLKWNGDEQQFRRLLDALPAGAYTCDAQGLITYFNRQAVQLWGREPKLNDPVDRYCGSFKLFAADGTPIQHDQCWMALALRERREFNGQEILVERPDGTRRTALAHANPIVDDSGALRGAFNVLVDITDAKQAETAQALLAAIVESSDDAIVSKTLEGRIRSWNAGAERLFGFTAAEAIGQPITNIIPPERRDEEQTILARLRAGERIEHYETVRQTKDGRHLHISLTISPLRDATGKIVGASKVARDITARKESEAALVALKNELATQLSDVRRLHEMSLRLSTMLEVEPVLQEMLRTAMAIESADFGLVSLTAADDERITIRASQGFDKDLLQELDDIPLGCDTCFRDHERVVIEDIDADPTLASSREVARRAGFRAMHCTPLLTRSGKMLGVLAMQFRQPKRPSDRGLRLVDLCARQAAEFIENAQLYEQLRRADRQKDEFLATLAHELRNPLAPVSNSLHIMRLSGDLSPSMSRVRDVMERQVNQMIRLVDDLLEVSRITRGKIELKREPIELAAVVRSAVETSRPLIDAAGHQLAITVDPEPITLEADPVRLAQVIANLLNNASKYTEMGGQIWLSARREGAEAVVSVKDTGVGIPAEMLPRVFDMFAQVDRTLKRSQGGLGIGLSLARSLISMHGGRIEARSAGPGMGSEFIVRLPLTAGVGRPLVVPPAPTSLGDRVRPTRRILVVDDTPEVAFALGKLLEAIGQDVRTVHGAAEAIREVRAQRPDIVISDIAMPQIDGYELARRLRAEVAMEGVMLVALTGYSQAADRQDALAAGFDRHLVKPVSLEALEQLLADLPQRPDGVSPFR
jgi:PAS domain S-box-containing protein